MDNLTSVTPSAVVMLSNFPKYFSRHIVKSIMGTTVKETEGKLKFLEYTGASETYFKDQPIRIEIAKHLSFSCHIYLNDFSDNELYEFMDVKLSYLLKSLKYIELYVLNPDKCIEKNYKNMHNARNLILEWKDQNIFKNAKYISLAFKLYKAEGMTLCNLIIFR